MTKKFLFYDDYSECAHPEVLAALAAPGTHQLRGYGADPATVEATALIRIATGQPKAAVHFVASGTLANLVCLASMLKPFESVIAEHNGHINVHEAGAIEALGHKINTVAGHQGKLDCDAVLSVINAHHGDQQMVRPKVVYLSQSTELGTFYTHDEIIQLHQLCQQHGLYLYVDGARLGQAMTASENAADLRCIAAHSDMFYIGGTKNGALMGEAVVIVNPALQSDFGFHMRQRGALLAKTGSVSTQFVALFQNELFIDNALHANRMARQLAGGLARLGYTFMHPTLTNQLFPVMPDSVIDKLSRQYGFHVWCKAAQPGHSVIRLVTSWSTPVSAIDDFLATLGTIA